MVKKVYAIRIPPLAHESITGIVEYIRKDSPKNAKMVGHKLYEKIASLSRLPNRFSPFIPLYSDARNFRSVAVWEFIIVYEVQENELLVNIFDVFHGSQNR